MNIILYLNIIDININVITPLRSRSPRHARDFVAVHGLPVSSVSCRAHSFGAKYCTPEVTKVKCHWKMPLKVHWKMPLEIHWTIPMEIH